MQIIYIIMALIVLLSPSASMAKDACVGECSSCHSLSINEASELIRPLDLTVRSVALSPLRGLFEVTAERDGKEGLIFIDFAKKFIMQGVMVSVESLKSGATKILQKNDIPKLLRVNSVLMGNRDAPKQLVVFSDPDCPYCRKLHAELLKLVKDEDLAVYIKPYPMDIHPGAYKKAQLILESGSLDVLNKAFAGEDLPDPKDVNNRAAVDDVISLAKSLELQGTPAILLPGGKIEIGFRSVETLKRLLKN